MFRTFRFAKASLFCVCLLGFGLHVFFVKQIAVDQNQIHHLKTLLFLQAQSTPETLQQQQESSMNHTKQQLFTVLNGLSYSDQYGVQLNKIHYHQGTFDLFGHVHSVTALTAWLADTQSKRKDIIEIKHAESGQQFHVILQI